MPYGPEVEALLSGINAIKDSALDALVSLANGSGYQLHHRGQHAGTASGPCTTEETEKGHGSATNTIKSHMSSIGKACDQMKSFANNLYTDPKGYNNNYGSPFTEIEQLKKAVNYCTSYNDAHAPFNYIGEKAGMMALLNATIQFASDAKQSLTTYQDDIQINFDTEKGEQSIQWVATCTGRLKGADGHAPTKALQAAYDFGFDKIGDLAGIPITNIGGVAV